MIRAACLLLMLTACGSSSTVSIDTREWACTAWMSERVQEPIIAGRAVMSVPRDQTVCIRWSRMKGSQS